MSPRQSLSSVTSKFSLWCPLTSDPVADYERSIYNYPWLSEDHGSSNNSTMRTTTIVSSLTEDEQHRPFQSILAPYSDRQIGSIDLHQASPSLIPEGNVLENNDEYNEESIGNSIDDTLEDSNLVTWSGPEDPTNPQNWPYHRKWLSTVLVSCFTFISPIASTMLAPALPELADKFNTTSGLETYLIMSIFLLAYAVGPFILAPLSEIYGRVVVLQAANMVFLIFNTACGFSQAKAQILVFRFLSGLGGAAPQALGGGVLSDCWRAEERGRATALYSLAPFLGPAIGPIAGGYLTQYMNWRWIFWAVSIADALVQVLAFLFLPETYRPKILADKAKKLRKATGNMELRTEAERKVKSLAHLLGTSFSRPLIMLLTQPTIQVTGLYRAYLYGLMYLVLASFPLVWEKQYGQEPGRASLNYLSLGIGFIIGLQISGPLIDKMYEKLKLRYNHPGKPEYRVPLMFPTAIIAPGGLLLYGLSAHFALHWSIPNIGAAIFAFGLILSFQCAQTYIVDTYETYAASATGAAAFIRTMAGFGFPLFAPGLYESIGIAWGNALLAGVATCVCSIAPAVLWRYGEWIRSKSRYCAG